MVPFAVDPGTATGDDFAASASGMLTFAGNAGETQTVVVTINGDNIVEGDQDLRISIGDIAGLSNAVLAQIDRPSDAVTLTIADDDTATVTLSDSVSVNEGDVGSGGQASFTVVLSNPVEGGFTLPVTVGGGTAMAGVDYVVPPTDLTFSGVMGESQNIGVTIIGDRIVENNEEFAVALGAASGLPADALSRLTIVAGVATGTILNDDTATVTLSGPAVVSEPGGPGGTAVATYTATLVGEVDGGLTVGFETTPGTATAGVDFASATGSLSFDGSDGQSLTFDVTVLGDADFEADETLTVGLIADAGLSPTIGGAVTVAADPLTLTITDDDSATVGFAQASSVVAETSGSHTVDVVLRTTGGAVLGEPLRLDVNVVGGSAGGDDFAIGNAAVTFPIGSRDGDTQTISLTLTQDNLLEQTETVVLGLQVASGDASGAVTANGGNHVVSITDDPSDAVIGGRLFVDSNGSGVRDGSEIAMSGVVVTLNGTNAIGESVSRQMITDGEGRYQFTDLVAGDYTVTFDQPAAFYAGRTTTGQIDGVAGGQASGATVSGIVLTPSQVASEFNFSVPGLRAGQISPYAFTARGPATLAGGLQLSAEAVDSVFARFGLVR